MKKIYRLLLLLPCILLVSLSARATIYPFQNNFSGTQEVPANASPGKGIIAGYYNDATNTISFTIIFGGLLTNTAAAHFHAPATVGVNAPVIIGYTGFPTGVTQGQYSNTYVITDLQETQLLAGLWYSNIHTTGLPGGEIRTQITLNNQNALYIFNNTYSGSQEVPPNASTATGRIIGSFNPTTNVVTYGLIYSGLTTPATAAHFHAPASPGTNAPVIIGYTGFPNATSGTYFNNSAVTQTQEDQFVEWLWYSNIHNPTFPGGEIRAQIRPNIPPTITCPNNFTLNNAPGQCLANGPLFATRTGLPTPALSFVVNGTTFNGLGSYNFPVGTTTVTAIATNDGGIASCPYTVTVRDVEAPVISNVSATPNSLWPPNHKMRDVTVNYATSDNCPGPVTTTLSVSSNEAQGNEADWIVVNNHNVKLRAERNGNGNGRIYTITITATDAAGNATSSSTTVTVAHDKGNGSRPANIEEEIITQAFKAKLTPNPSSGYFVLNLQSDDAAQKISIRVHDISGRLVETLNNLSANGSVRIGQALKPGMYVLSLMENGRSSQIKIVKL